MILPADPRFQPISEGLSTGLSGLLEGLAEGKAKEMHTKNLFNSLKGLNVDPRKAMAVALLPPESQGAAIQQLLQQPIKNQEIVRPQVLEAQHNFQIANQMKPLVDDLRALIKDPDLRSPQAQALIDKLGLHGAAINTPQQLFEKANKRLALYGGQLQGCHEH